MNRVLRRSIDAMRSLVRWYLTPTGALVVIASIAAIIVSVVAETPLPVLLLAAFILLIVFPWKLVRGQASLNTVKKQLLDRANAAESSARDEAQKLRNFVQNERRNYLGSLESARGEWADVLSSERLMRNAEEDRMTAQYEDALAQIAKLETEIDSLRASMGDIASIGDQVTTARAEAAAGVEEALRTHEGRVEAALRQTEGQIINRVDGRLQSERAARLLETARLRASTGSPERMLVILTPQRTGSTLLMDALRSYPGVGMWPTARYFNLLGATGRRYPGDLSPDAGTGEVLEVQPGVGGIVPGAHGSWDAERSLGSPKIALEKIHPMTVDFDPDEMLSRMDHLARDGIQVDVVYQLRDPVDSIRSFLAYQQRAERWHPDMSGEDVIAQYAASYEMMERLIVRQPGPVVAYPQFKETPSHLAAVYEAVFGANRDEAVELAAEVLAVPNPETRKSTQKGPFVDSDRSGIPARTQILLGWPQRDESAKNRIDELMAVYQRLAERALDRAE